MTSITDDRRNEENQGADQDRSKNTLKTTEKLEELGSEREVKPLGIDGKLLDVALVLDGTSEPIMTFRRTVIRPFALNPEDRIHELVTFMFAKAREL